MHRERRFHRKLKSDLGIEVGDLILLEILGFEKLVKFTGAYQFPGTDQRSLAFAARGKDHIMLYSTSDPHVKKTGRGLKAGWVSCCPIYGNDWLSGILDKELREVNV